MLTTARPGTSSAEGPLKGCLHEADHIPLVWDQLEPMIERSIKAGRGEITTEAVYAMLVNGHAFAFTAHRNEQVEIVLVVRPVLYSAYTVVRIIACAGRNLKEALHLFEGVELWALGKGAVELEAWCRPAMSRLLKSPKMGWASKFEVLSKDLRRKLQ